MGIIEGKFIGDTSYLSLNEVEKDNKKYIYGEFHKTLSSYDSGKHQKRSNLGIEGILSPVELINEDGIFKGYLMDYVDGVSLSQTFYDIPFDGLINGVKYLSQAYFAIAEKGYQLEEIELSDLMCSGGKLIHIGVDGFKDVQSKIPAYVCMESMNVLKSKLIKQLESLSLSPEISKVLVADSKRLIPIEKLLRDFKEAIKLSYGIDLITLSELRGAKNGNKEKSIGNSWTNRSW